MTLYVYKAKVVEVIDGDTLELMIDLGLGVFRKERVRLFGIDAPEMRFQKGKEARSYLINLIDAAKLVEQKATGQEPIFVVKTIKDRTDKYGRYLVMLYDSIEDIPDDIDVLIHAKSLDRGSFNWQMVLGNHAVERYW